MALHEVFESMIAEASASFGFSGFSCDPDGITAALGIPPDDLMRKGQERTVGARGRIITNPLNSWSISSSGNSKDVNDHLRELLERLAGKRSLLDPAFGEPCFGIMWKASFLQQGTGPYYEPDVLHGIALLGATLYQELIAVDESEC